MAARVTDAEIKEILDTTLTTTPFIAAATLLVDQYLLSASLSEALLKEIERWVAAHLVCVNDPRLRALRTQDTSVDYETGQAGTGLQATTFGQQAIALDPTGRLKLISISRPATLTVI